MRDIAPDFQGRVWFAANTGASYFDGLWRSFSQSDGLPDSEIASILHASDGTLWFGTMQGIAVYDGVRWSALRLPDSLELGQEVFAMAEAAPGVFWIGTNQGAARYDGVRWDKLPLPEMLQGQGVSAILANPQGELWLGFTNIGSLMHFSSSVVTGQWEILQADGEFPGGSVHALVEDDEGDVWLGTDEGLARYNGTQWEWLGTVPVNDAASEPGAGVWFATSAGLQHYNDGQRSIFGVAEGLVSNDITAVSVDQYGRLWAGTRERGVSFTDRSWQTWERTNGLPVSEITAISQDAEEHIWSGGKQGLAEYVDGAWEPVYLPSGQEIRGITLGASRRLWLATERGIAVFDGFGWVYHTQEDGLGSDDVHAVMMDSAGRIWAGHSATTQESVTTASRSGFSWYDGFQWQTIGTESPVVTLLEDQQGSFWVGTAQHGLKYIPGGAVQDITTRDGLISNQVTTLAETPDGRIWIGTSVGISIYDGQQWSSITTDEGLVDNRVICITVINDEEMWVGTQDGVSTFDGNRWNTLTAEDGLPSNRIDTIYETLDGDIWVGSAAGGVSQHRPERIAPRVEIISGPRGTIGVRAASFVFQGGDASTPRDELLYSYRLGIQDWSPFVSNTFVSFSNLSDGDYTFFVRAQDQARNISRAAQVNFTIDATEPIVIIRRPIEGEVIRGDYAIFGTATDATDFAGFQVEAGPEFIETSATPVPDGVLATWDTRALVDGRYSIVLSAWDAVDPVTGIHDVSHTLSITVGVQVDNTPPVVEISAPLPGSVQQGQVEIRASMVDLHLSEFILRASRKLSDGSTVASIIRAGKVTGQSVQLPVSWDSSSLDGPVTIQLNAFDSAGNEAQAQVSIQLDNASARPETRIEFPVEGAIVSDVIEITGAAVDTDLRTFELSYRTGGNVDWVPISSGNQSIPSGRLGSWNTLPLADGEYDLMLLAEDSNGYENQSTLSVTIDNTPPQIEIVAPATDQVIASSNRLEIQGVISDPHLRDYRLEYALPDAAGQWIEISAGNEPGPNGLLAAWNTLGLDGEVTLRLTATDLAQPSPNVAEFLHAIVLDSTPAQIEITSPEQNQVVSDIVLIEGTVHDEHLERYEIAVRSAEGGDQLLLVTNPGQSQFNAMLVKWDTQGLMGEVEIRVDVWEQSGRQHTSVRSVVVDNDPPEVTWQTPFAGAQIRGSVSLTGTVRDANLLHYIIEYLDLSRQSTTDENVWLPVTEAPVSQTVEQGFLATWHTQDLPGDYVLRLTGVDRVGHEHTCESVVHIPEPVDAAQGGVVTDQGSAVRLTIPPHALKSSGTFTINATTSPATAGVQSTASVPTYNLEPTLEFPVAKPAVLEMALPDPGISWAIFRWEPQRSEWEFLGGTPTGSMIRVPVTQLGTFQLQSTGVDDVSGERVASLHCQPRRFSPKRDDKMAISFVLGRGEPVDVFVFDGAGRLRASIADSVLLPPGGNVILWDGTDRDNALLPTGPYLVVVRTGNHRLQQGIVVWNQ